MPNKVVRVNQIPVKGETQRPSSLSPLLYNIIKVKVKKRDKYFINFHLLSCWYIVKICLELYAHLNLDCNSSLNLINLLHHLLILSEYYL